MANNFDKDAMLDAADYAVTAASALGVDLTPIEISLFAAETARLLAASETVRKPKNETAKLIASGVSLLLGEATGKKRAMSTLELIAMGIIDITITK